MISQSRILLFHLRNKRIQYLGEHKVLNPSHAEKVIHRKYILRIPTRIFELKELFPHFVYIS